MKKTKLPPISNLRPFVSVIMPSYNSERFLSVAIKSVIDQIYTNWELIIIDDFSSDNSLSISQKFSYQDSRITTYRNAKNMGVSYSRNLGINLSKGEFIAFLDSDDKWMNNKLEMQVKLSVTNNYQFLITGCSYINEENYIFPGKIIPSKIISYSNLLKTNQVSCSSVFINKNLLNNIKFENDKIHEDYYLWLRILKEGNLIYTIPELLLQYRLYSKSKSGNKFKSIKMTFGVYRSIGFGLFKSFLFTLRHLTFAFLKYFRILKGI
jgi:teichuronic acid biosynthesis glycosyltransferase TuaG